MKKIIVSLIACFLILINTSLVYAIGNDKLPNVPRLSAFTALMLYKQGTCLMIDANPRVTFLKARILGAINMPNDGLSDIKRLRSARINIPKDKVLIVY